jgi:hypothetical protein
MKNALYFRNVVHTVLRSRAYFETSECLIFQASERNKFTERVLEKACPTFDTQAKSELTTEKSSGTMLK